MGQGLCYSLLSCDIYIFLFTGQPHIFLLCGPNVQEEFIPFISHQIPVKILLSIPGYIRCILRHQLGPSEYTMADVSHLSINRSQFLHRT